MRLGGIADFGARVVTRVLRLNRPSKWSVRVADNVNDAVIEIDGLRFCANAWLPLMRAQTLLTKEPDTIEWIRAMTPGSVFWDVGANVGIYTIYAASRGLRVFAFEPEASNFSILNRNIALNTFNALAYPIALAAKCGLDTLRLGDLRPGGALHSFGTNIDYRGKAFTPLFEQGSISVTLDELAYDFGLPSPDHIKIDVDGLEGEIVKGGERLLPSVKSVLIEVNSNLDQPLINRMREHGFTITGRGKLRTEDNVFNAIFTR